MPDLLRPPALRAGDTVAVLSPSSPMNEQGTLDMAAKRLRQMGFQVIVGPHASARHGHLAGTDAERLSDLHEMFGRDDVHAIICMRGGNGAPRLLADLDYDLIRSHPKILIGYSDITALHLAIHARTGLVTFHGPVLSGLHKSEYSRKWFVRALMSREPLGEIDDPDETPDYDQPYPPPRVVITVGAAGGRLTGGNLTLVEQTLGTPYEVDTHGRILFLEDTGEEPYSVDRMLTHLRHAGKLQQATAILFGESTDCGIKDTFLSNFSLEDVIRDRLSDLNVPVVYGMRFGHGKHQFTLPLGVHATLSAGAEGVRLVIEEAAAS